MSKKKLVWVVVGVLACLGIGFGLYFLLVLNRPAQLPEQVFQPEQSSQEPQVQEEENPLNWQELKSLNEDIYAWLEVAGTEIAQPIVQRFGDDSYYLRRDIYGNYSAPGTVFTEYQYNSTTFEDPVTMVYGHDMTNGTMFGPLQDVIPQMTLDESSVFYIYLPERKLTYQIFAALPHDNSHVMYYNDFSSEEGFTQFFDGIMSTRDLRANLNPQAAPKPGDHVVILSTCLRGDNTHRYLVMGKLVDEVPLSSTLS